MSGIIVSETARASASGDTCRIRSLASRLTEFTLIYAVFSAGVLIRFGRPIGEALGGGSLAGNMISAIAPVIPFIYMEIVLEAMIKGMGLQGFSSLNYLAEYAVRISVVLTVVPHFGFIGIAASYYTSNVIGNISRCIKLSRASGCGLHPVRNVLLPAVYTFMTMCASELIVRTVSGGTETIPQAVFMTLLWGCGYTGIFVLIKRSKVRSTPCQTCKIGKSLSN